MSARSVGTRAGGRSPRALASAACAAVFALAGCGDSTILERHGSLDEYNAQVSQSARADVFGHAVELIVGDRAFVGELLGCDSHAVFLRSSESGVTEGAYMRMPWRALSRARVFTPRNTTALAVWTTVGSLSTASHGIWFVVGLPVWLATGIPSTIAESRRIPEMETCEQLRPYARFPQGVPPVLLARIPGAEPQAPPSAFERRPGEIWLPPMRITGDDE